MHCFRIQIDLACHVRENLVPNEVSQLRAALEAPFRPPVALGLLWEKELSVAATLQTGASGVRDWILPRREVSDR